MKQPGDGSGCSIWDSGAKHSLHKAAGPPCLPRASGQHVKALSRHSQYTAPFRQLGLAQSLSQGPLCDSRGPGLFLWRHVRRCTSRLPGTDCGMSHQVTFQVNSQFESTIWTVLHSVVHTLQTRRRGKKAFQTVLSWRQQPGVSSQKGPVVGIKGSGALSSFPLSYIKEKRGDLTENQNGLELISTQLAPCPRCTVSKKRFAPCRASFWNLPAAEYPTELLCFSSYLYKSVGLLKNKRANLLSCTRLKP